MLVKQRLTLLTWTGINLGLLTLLEFDNENPTKIFQNLAGIKYTRPKYGCSVYSKLFNQDDFIYKHGFTVLFILIKDMFNDHFFKCVYVGVISVLLCKKMACHFLSKTTK